MTANSEGKDGTVSVAQAAELLGVGKALVYAKVRTGEIPGWQIGDRWVIARSTIDAIRGPGDVDYERLARAVARKQLVLQQVGLAAQIAALDQEEERERNTIEMRKWRRKAG